MLTATGRAANDEAFPATGIAATMSEYQYYEFQAVDRPLDEGAMAALRALSSRARITPTSFVNEYNFGDFKGNPAMLMERYFDLHLYVANWGTRRLMLRLPKRFLDPGLAESYGVEARGTAEHTILEFECRDENGDYWDDSVDGSGRLASLAPLRADLIQGDLRCLYLGWVLALQDGMVEGGEREPPVPCGLGRLTEPLAAFAEFMRLDQDLLAAAAATSGKARHGLSRAAIEARLHALPEAEKTALLLRFVAGDDPLLGAELRRRFTADVPTPNAASRTAAELLAAARALEDARRRREAERAAKEKARRERQQAAARARYLDQLAAREESIWRETAILIDSKQAANYDRAVALLKDLRDLDARRDKDDEFTAALRSLRSRHAKKPSFLARLDKEGLAA